MKHSLAKKLLELTVTAFFWILFSLHDRPLSNVAQRVARLYGNQGFNRLFTKIRWWNAPLEEIEKIVPKKGLIWDLGCGDGFLTNYLALSKTERKVIGVEVNEDRIFHADKGLPNTRFITGDVVKQKISSADGILLIDVLHHLSSYNKQEKLVKYCSDNLNNNGVLIISEIISQPLVKYMFTKFTDMIIFPILFEKKLFCKNIFYRSRKDWEILLSKFNLKVGVKYAHHGKPFSHAIFICQKSALHGTT